MDQKPPDDLRVTIWCQRCMLHIEFSGLTPYYCPKCRRKLKVDVPMPPLVLPVPPSSFTPLNHNDRLLLKAMRILADF